MLNSLEESVGGGGIILLKVLFVFYHFIKNDSDRNNIKTKILER